MKIALCQLNPTVGDLAANRDKIVAFAERARGQGADVSLFPELALTGYPPKDLLSRRAFVDDVQRAVLALAAELACGRPVVVGAPWRDGSGRLVNAALWLENGRVAHVVEKTLLPTYDVFDETRYFENNLRSCAPIAHQNHRLGVSVCEDIWNDGTPYAVKRYPRNPIAELCEQGAGVILNLSASPFEVGKERVREQLLGDVARHHGRPVLYCNQIGGNDSLVFDGRSLWISERGEVLARGAAFEEDLILCDLTAQPAPATLTPMPPEEEMARGVSLGIADYVRKCRFPSVVIGLSGGIDSALTAVLAADALGPERVHAVSMPSRYSSEHSKTDAALLAKGLGIHYEEVPIDGPFQAYLDTLAPAFQGTPEDTTEENLQARVRGNVLMALSNKRGHLVLSTGNKSELAVGYCTLYGDMCGGLAVISDLYKLEVYAVSRWLNRERERIPHNTLIKPPSAELRPNQTDQDSLPPYEVLDAILRLYVDQAAPIAEIVAAGHAPQIVRRVVGLVDRNEYKRRQAAPGLKVSGKAFGEGRRLPLAQNYREAGE